MNSNICQANQLVNCNALTLYVKTYMIPRTDKNGNRIGKRAYPLRMIISENIPGEINGQLFRRLNLLECGHYVHRSSDIYGETCPVKQRCRQCYKNLEK